MKTIKYWDKALTLVHGCSEISAGCQNCWLRQMGHRFRWPLVKNGKWTKEVIPDMGFLNNGIRKLKRKKPTIFHVWSDLFHPQVPASYIINVIKIMGALPHHTFLILSKRPERFVPVLYGEEGDFFLDGRDYYSNIWFGTSVENQATANKRLIHLRSLRHTNTEIKTFISAEPLLERTHLFLNDVQPSWVVTGAETGLCKRPSDISWFVSIVDQCVSANIVPLLIKQDITVSGLKWQDVPFRKETVIDET